MYSTKGRPRQVTDAQVEAILEWRRTHKPLRVFAAELGLKKSTVQYVIERNGQYKQPSPEKRVVAVSERRRKVEKLRQDGWL
ncbi:MAG: helix-turn-helix domain-containing protein [Steroidobacteraceae bacterium]